MTRPNPKLAKLHRSYTVEEVARLYGVHRHTVRGWLKAGLAAIDNRRPLMIQGQVLRAFLEARQARAKRPCSPGTLYCCKCRAPRGPAAGSAVFETQADRAGTFRAICEVCGTRNGLSRSHTVAAFEDRSHSHDGRNSRRGRRRLLPSLDRVRGRLRPALGAAQ